MVVEGHTEASSYINNVLLHSLGGGYMGVHYTDLYTFLNVFIINIILKYLLSINLGQALGYLGGYNVK